MSATPDTPGRDALGTAAAAQLVLPVVLAGGSGTRLWPLSRALRPKQFLAISGEQTLFQQAVLRLAAIAGAGIELAAPCVVANEEHRFTISDQLRTAGFEPESILLESSGRNTAPALTMAALQAMREGADPILIVTPADHAITDGAAFTAALRRAVAGAASGSIVVLGIRPNRPETGYGYIRTGAPEGEGGIAPVAAFVEKPDIATAESYLADGGYFWNSGMFVLRASRWLFALERFRPDIASAAQAAWRLSTRDRAFVRFDAVAFDTIPAESIDYAVMEPASRPDSGVSIGMVMLDAGWSDLGAWDAVWQVAERDASGNASRGDAIVTDSRNTLVHATSRLVGVIGLDDVTVVETADAVLVAHRSKSPAVKDLVADLARAGRPEATVHSRVYRPWGWYESVDQGPRFQVKRILVNPGERLSLQMHHHRAEHWIVVTGTAEVTNGDAVMLVSENESTFIPLGQKHRLANPGKVPLEIIEVQSGAYLGEDDIVRFEDIYDRR
ncbi:MAG: mannose-1-phosphate guanylyltransferase/mannose-6-phosphate isomerase [Burkholderiales bacterium]|nr:mannose-1-phosphate guanylyltransferase/mannose-6-phosphate isomerase [Burkholderiales bacterium]